MRLQWSFIALFLCATSVFASTVVTHSEYVVKDSHRVPDGWQYVRKAPLDHEIELHIALKQANFDILEKHLYEGKLSNISDRIRRSFVAYQSIPVSLSL